MKKRTEAKQGVAEFANGQFYKEIGIKLAERRLNQGWTMSALASKTDIHIGKIRNMDAGKIISLETLSTVLRAFSVDPGKFLPEHSGNIIDLVPGNIDLEAIDQTATKRIKTCSAQLMRVTKSILEFSEATGIPDTDEPDSENVEVLGPTYSAASRVEILAAFGQRVRIARTLRGYSLHVLAQRSNVPLNSMYVLELGLRNPTMETVYRLAKGLECPVAFLIPGIHDDPTHLQNLDYVAYALETRSLVRDLARAISVIDATTLVADTILD